MQGFLVDADGQMDINFVKSYFTGCCVRDPQVRLSTVRHFNAIDSTKFGRHRLGGAKNGRRRYSRDE